MVATNKDILIGKKLRQLRNVKGISQDSLASEAGITFQQVQKYEKGVNRISASRLFDFSKILNVDVKIFFDPIIAEDANLNSESSAFAFNEDESATFVKQDIFESKETINLVREYYKITDPAKRKNVLEVIKAMSVAG